MNFMKNFITKNSNNNNDNHDVWFTKVLNYILTKGLDVKEWWSEYEWKKNNRNIVISGKEN